MSIKQATYYSVVQYKPDIANGDDGGFMLIAHWFEGESIPHKFKVTHWAEIDRERYDTRNANVTFETLCKRNGHLLELNGPVQ